MKKTISFIMSIVMAIALIPKISTSVSAMGYDPSIVVNLALSKVGTNYMNGYCLAFVRQMFESAYGYSSTNCCAYKYGSRFIDSTSRTNIPLGADVFFGGSSKTCSTCGNKCGHIGIYVGDDYVVHGWSGKIEKFKIDRIINAGYPYRGWGWHNDIALGDVSTNPDDYSFPERNLYYQSTNVLKGSDVGWIQAVLYQCGYDINIDCSYGPATKSVVEQFQRDNGLTVDGKVGPETREKLRQKWEAKKQSNITLVSISVATNPNKTTYLIGEALDLTGLTLTATYSNGAKKTVTEDYSVSGFDSSKAGTKTLTVSFDGKTTTFTVTVKEPEPTTYTITYNANGGTGTMADTVMTVGTAKNLAANTFTRTGYTFLGWSKDKNAAAATYADKQSVKDLAQSGTVTLYAVWEENASIGGGNFDISAKTENKTVNSEIRFSINDGQPGLQTLTYTVQFDPKVLKYSEDSYFPYTSTNVNTKRANEGIVIVTTILTADPNESFKNAHLSTMLFDVVTSDPGTTYIKVYANDAYGAEGAEITFNSKTVNISLNEIKLGDINGDGKVNSLDALWALQTASENRTLTSSQFLAADVNKDGKVNSLDALWILQAASGNRQL